MAFARSISEFVRLETSTPCACFPQFLETVENDGALLDGAPRAVAMLHMSFDQEVIASILEKMMGGRAKPLL
jgi:hypothetical protein